MQAVVTRLVASAVFMTLAGTSASAQPAIAGPLLAQASAPSAAETDFWRSTERLDTIEAYQAYLAAFPNGFYALLARAGIAKLQAVSGSATDTSARLQPTKPQGKLQAFSKQSSSKSAQLTLGSQISGPALLQIGHVGARKQIVLPAGQWILLSAIDHQGSTTFANINVNATMHPTFVTTLVFGKFAGNRLTSTLAFTATTKVPHVAVVYEDADECQKQRRLTNLHQWRNVRAAQLQQCIQVAATSEPMKRGLPTDSEVADSLKQLGAEFGGMAIASDLFFTDRTNGYLRITRMDWPLGASSNLSDWQANTARSDTVRLNYLSTLTGWLERYRPVAQRGFGKQLSVAEQQLDSVASNSPELAGLDDFDPSKPIR